jgi:hypothetical protein
MPHQAEEGDSTRIVCEWMCMCVCLGLSTIVMVENTTHDNYTMYMISFP